MLFLGPLPLRLCDRLSSGREHGLTSRQVPADACLHLSRLHVPVEVHVGVFEQLCVRKGARIAPPLGLQRRWHVCRQTQSAGAELAAACAARRDAPFLSSLKVNFPPPWACQAASASPRMPCRWHTSAETHLQAVHDCERAAQGRTWHTVSGRSPPEAAVRMQGVHLNALPFQVLCLSEVLCAPGRQVTRDRRSLGCSCRWGAGLLCRLLSALAGPRARCW